VVKPVRKDPIDNKTEAANQLRLLGAVQVMWGGEMIAKPGPRKMLALLGYLALQDNAVARDALVGLFWGELPESKARNNLRVTLSRLTKKCLASSRQNATTYIFYTLVMPVWFGWTPWNLSGSVPRPQLLPRNRLALRRSTAAASWTASIWTIALRSIAGW